MKPFAPLFYILNRPPNKVDFGIEIFELENINYFLFHFTAKRVQHRWSEAEDKVLLTVIAAKRPTTIKAWDCALMSINGDSALRSSVTRRAVRERFELILKNHKKETNKRLAELVAFFL